MTSTFHHRCAVVNETLDSILDGSDDEREGEEIMNQILDEIGLDIQTSAQVPLKPLSSSSLQSKLAQSSASLGSCRNPERMPNEDFDK